DAREHRILLRGSLGDRAVGYDGHAIRAACRDGWRLIDERMNLDLVAEQRLGAQIHRLLQQSTMKIRYPDMPGESGAFHLAKRADRLRERNPRTGAMQRQQIDFARAQACEAVHGGALELRRCKMRWPHLGGDKDIVARHARSAE